MPVLRIAGAIAIAGADLVWLGYAWQALGGGIVVPTADVPWFVGAVGLGIALDLVTVRVAWRSSARQGLVMGYLGFRAFLSAVGFLFLTLPFYLVAFGALGRSVLNEPTGDPDDPHPFAPQSGGWFRPFTPVSWSQNLLGASQYGARSCTLCGHQESDPIHAQDGAA